MLRWQVGVGIAVLCFSSTVAKNLRTRVSATSASLPHVGQNASALSVLGELASTSNCSAPDDLLTHVQNASGDIGFIQTLRFAVYTVDHGRDMSIFAYDCVRKKKLLFIHIPKNAGTTIEDLGQRTHTSMRWGLYTLDGEQRMPDGNVCSRWHVPPSLLKGYNPYKDSSAEVFCVTRDPWDRVISEYTYELQVDSKWQAFRRFSRLGPPCTEAGLNKFVLTAMAAIQRGSRWISDCHLLPQWDYIRGPRGRDWCDHKLSMEHLTPEFNALMTNHGIPLRMAPHHKRNTASECPSLARATAAELQAMLWPETKSAMRRVYREDFSHLGDALARDDSR